MIDVKVDSVLSELNAFFKVAKQLIKDFYESADQAEERDSLVTYTINEISSTLEVEFSDLEYQIAFLKKLQSRLENEFQLGDVINDQFRNNIKTFIRSPEKYNYNGHAVNMQTLHDIYNAEIAQQAKATHAEMLQNLASENYKLANIKLPYTGINEQKLACVLNSIKSAGIFKEVVEYILIPNCIDVAPNEFKPYLLELLDYD